MRHIGKFFLISTAVFLFWLILSTIGWSSVFGKRDLWIVQVIHLPLVLYGAPFRWVKPGSVLDGPALLALPALFWGGILYASCLGIAWLRRAQPRGAADANSGRG
jgi:hypothetical protein